MGLYPVLSTIRDKERQMDRQTTIKIIKTADDGPSNWMVAVNHDGFTTGANFHGNVEPEVIYEDWTEDGKRGSGRQS